MVPQKLLHDKTHVWNLAISRQYWRTYAKIYLLQWLWYLNLRLHTIIVVSLSQLSEILLKKIFHISFKDSEKIYVNCPSFIPLCLPLCNCQEKRIILRKCVVKQIAIHRKCFTINHTLFRFKSRFSFPPW